MSAEPLAIERSSATDLPETITYVVTWQGSPILPMLCTGVRSMKRTLATRARHVLHWLGCGVSVITGVGSSACYSGADASAAGDSDSGDAGDAGDAGDSSGDTTDPSSGDPIDPPPEDAHLIPRTMARRLTRAELDNTIRDLVGDAERPATQLLGEPEFAPFDNDYTLQTPSRALVESLEVLAKDVADRFVTDTGRRGQIMPCSPTGSAR